MADQENYQSLQLKETCKLTGARWAAWLERSASGWVFALSANLTKARQSAIDTFFSQGSASTWLAGAFSSGRTRSRQTGAAAADVGCQRIYVFPNLEQKSALIVGADSLDRQAEGFFRVLSYRIQPGLIPAETASLDLAARFAGGSYQTPKLEAAETAPSAAFSFGLPDVELESAYNPVEVLKNVLEYLAGLAPCDAALLTIRSGDAFRVEAAWNYPVQVIGREIYLQESPLLRKIVSSQEGLIMEHEANGLSLTESLNLSIRAEAWMGAPVVLGRRVIGHLAFVSSQKGAFTREDLQRVTAQAARLAYVVENAIVLSEATRYLQQLALLNELASVASLGIDTHEVAERVIQRLLRTFKASSGSVFLLSQDGKLLREYGMVGKEGAIEREGRVLPVRTSLVGSVVQTGLSIRIGDIKDAQDVRQQLGTGSASTSVMAVALKYRGNAIGALSLESEDSAAFSTQDEQLLSVIASHMAGLFENVRLNEETRQRARNLSLIHQVVRRVLGLTDISEICAVAAELMVRRFSYELVSIILPDEHTQTLVIRGARGVEKKIYSNRPAAEIGLSGRVLAGGNSRLSPNAAVEAGYVPHPGWNPGSEMCVALREGEKVIGAIDVQNASLNAFTEADLLALEALAGVLSSVILSARRYRELQDSVRQLQAVRETAMDIAADLDLDAMLMRVVHRARDLVGARGAELGLLDEKDETVKILVSETPWFNYRGEKIQLLTGVAGRVAAEGEPLVVEDYNTWEGRLYPDQKAPFRTVAGVPLKFKNKVIGTLTLIDDRLDFSFRPEHIQLLELLAPQATIWIRHARLYQELQERIEAQRLAESRLIRTARLAAVGEMAAGVAHELNNPLTTVSGFVELVLEELPQDSPHRADLELVWREAQRARGVVRRMLDFSRPPDNQRIRTNLNELAADILTLVNHLARTQGIEITIHLEEILPWASIDPAQIKQVLLNLLHNAIQAMPTGGQLDVSTRQAERDGRLWAVLAVSDTGEGISPDNLERIFEPFFTTRPAGKGTGLGLSVSYGIVTEHQGLLEVESSLGEGSCFTVWLPVEKEEPADG